MARAALRQALAAAATLLAAATPLLAAPPSAREGPTIIVRPPPTEAERREVLRDFAREVIRPPRMRHPVAKFAFPVCVEVLGLAPSDAELVAGRIRDNAAMLGVGADAKPDCTPTVRVAFMAPAAGPAAQWLTMDSPQLAHLASYQRARVLAEDGPVRAWNRVVMRDSEGQPFMHETARAFGDPLRFPDYTMLEPMSSTDPIPTAEITGAAVLIARGAAERFSMLQLADYATMRALLGTDAPGGEVPTPTILTLFSNPAPPPELTEFDRALVRELYDASRNAKPRRVFNDIARTAAAAEQSGERGD